MADTNTEAPCAVSGNQLKQPRNEQLQDCMSRISQVKQHLEECMTRIGIILPPVESKENAVKVQEDNLLNTLDKLPAHIIKSCDEIHNLMSIFDENIL